MIKSYGLLTDPRQKILYSTICDSLVRHAKFVPLPTDKIKPEEISIVIKAVLTDIPELFWFEGK